MADEGRTALYRLYDANDDLLYVGITDKLKRRWYQHSASQTWWPDVSRKTVEWWDTRKEAELAETAVIRDEHPRHNARLDTDGKVRVPDRAFDIRAAERRVAATLQAEIEAGDYPPGFDMPRQAIAQRLGVPILAVSFALSRLANAKVLTRRHNRYFIPSQGGGERA